MLAFPPSHPCTWHCTTAWCVDRFKHKPNNQVTQQSNKNTTYTCHNPQSLSLTVVELCSSVMSGKWQAAMRKAFFEKRRVQDQ